MRTEIVADEHEGGSREIAVPLTDAQKEMWLLAQRDDSASRAYNVPLVLGLRGPLNTDALRQAIEDVVARHEALRTTISLDGSEQHVASSLMLDVPVVDLSSLPASERDGRLKGLLTAAVNGLFDLAHGPLFRASLVRIEPAHHLLLLVVHHIVTDGWSMGVLAKDIADAYAARLRGATHEKQPPLQLREYSGWLNQQLQDPSMDDHESYWLAHLSGPLPQLELPTDRRRPQGISFSGARETLTMGSELVRRLFKLSQENNCTPFMTLLAGYMALLHRLSGQDDLIVVVPVASRALKGGGELVGYCVNIVPIRGRLSRSMTFQQYLTHLRGTVLDAYKHAAYPFVSSANLRKFPSDPSRPLLFGAFFNMNAPLTGALRMPDIDIDLLEAPIEYTLHELSLDIVPVGDELHLELGYNSDLFNADTVARFARRLMRLFEQVAADPTQRLAQLDLLTMQERRNLLVEWNATRTDYPKDQCLHQLFEAQVAKTPDAVAVVFEDQSLTYAELDRRADQLADYLRTVGVGAETLVGICAERSLELVIGLLGILKAGGAYVPLDPDYPAERLGFMLEDVYLPVVLTQSHLRDRLPPTEAWVVALDTQWEAIAQESQHTPPSALVERAGLRGSGPQSLAYVIFTSGSTGRPKGVGVPHAAIVNRLQWMQAEYGLDATDRVLQKTPFSFDVSVWEFFWPLLAGARLVVARPGGHKDSAYLAELIAQEAITTLHFVPPMLAVFLEEPGVTACRALRRVICSGEALPLELMQRHFERLDVPLHNLYGPTEAAVDVSYWACEPDTELASVPIGRPVANTQLHILDLELNPVPVGVMGELYIGGVQLARGYLNRPDMTAEKFIPNPFSEVPGERLYRTGDLARHLPDGNIEFLGRLDHQVKVRGFRIELGEIEAMLAQHPAVREAVVVARPDVPGDGRLVAYVVASDVEADVGALRAYLKDKLPEYMVPAAFVVLEALPLTPNGKVDRKALPAPGLRVEPAQAYVAPRTPAEEFLAEIWGEVLGVERVGIHDNFFDLGGHSLLVTQIVSRLRAAFGTELPLRALFEAPTLAELAQAVEAARQAGVGPQAPPIMPLPRDGALPLSFAQQRLWFLDRLEPNNPFYNIPGAVRLRGALDAAVLARSLNALIERHEALRTTFASVDGEAVQVIAPTLALELPVVDLCKVPSSEGEEKAQALITEEAQRPFDLAEGPLLRAHLLRLAEEDHLLQVTFHHIVADGWSLAVFVDELATLYRALMADQATPLEPLPIQYADFAHWQRQWLQGEVLDQQLAYWREQLEGLPALLELPTDRPRPPVQSFHGAHHPITISPELTGALHSLSREAGVTLFMTLLAAFQVLLARYTGQRDFAVGTPIANRNRAETEGLIGFFVNTLVLRTDLSDNPSFSDLLARTKETTLGAYAHQDLPFERLVDELSPERDMSHSPLFQVMFALQTAPLQTARLPGLRLTPWALESGTAKFDLSLELAEEGDVLTGTLEYNTDLFEVDTIRRLAGHYRILLEGILKAPQSRVSHLPLLTSDEQQQLLVDWNATETDYPRGQCLHELFEAQVEKTPDATAVVFEDQSLTYAELNAKANQLADYLRAQGVGPDVPVGVFMERSLELVASLYGILKAGGAYVPLDPDYPAERLGFMLEDIELPVVLTQSHLQDRVPPTEARVVALDTQWEAIAQESEHTFPSPLGERAGVRGSGPQNLAYVIFTSGSTGRPKGVGVPQEGIVNRLQWMQAEYGLDATDRVLQKTPFSFDVSVWEFFWPLITGARLVVAKPGGHKDSAYLVDLIAKQQITTLHFVPPMLAVFLEEPAIAACSSLRRVICSGEALPIELMQRHGARLDVPLHNLYGPTEASVDVSYWACDPDTELASVPIGRPVANTQLYLLDGELNPVPVGVAGELYIGGVQLARGYLNRPDLTADKFIPNAFSQTPGARLYRTGDLARYRPDGNIEFLGRMDHQVKIRGFRIELGEIETTLTQHPAVREAVVVSREDSPGDKRLVAYLVSSADAEPDTGALRTFLKDKLPDYMVPAAFVLLDGLPLSPNGKVDRKALPAPEGQAGLAHDYVAPRTPTEQTLAEIWAEVLGLERTGIHDNFFELGGHSLLVTQVVSRMRAAFATELPLRALFEAPTVAELAHVVETARHASDGLQAPSIVPVARDGALPLSFAQQRLWFLDQLAPQDPFYNMPGAVRLQGALDITALERSLNALIARHEALRTTFCTANGEAVQVIAPALELNLPVSDLTELPAEAREIKARAFAAEEAQRPFDLAAGPLLRAQLLRLAEEDHLLQVTFHHIVADGWSLGVFIEELAALYRALVSGQSMPLAPLPIQYADFAHWQRQWLQDEVLEQQLAYWREQLKDLPPLLELPTDRPRPAMQTFHGAHHPITISVELTQALHALSHEAGVTLFMTLLAAFQVLLARYTGQCDLAVGTPIANRNRAETEGLIGCFINTLVLRAVLSDNPSFKALLARTKETTLGAYAHQDLPFERLVDELQPERDMSHAPLFQVMFALQNVPLRPVSLPGLQLTPWALESGTAKFDLTLEMAEEGEALTGTLEYNTDLFEAATIARLAGHLTTLLEGIAKTPAARIAELPLLTAAERQQLLLEWNATQTDFPKDQCIHQLFEAQVEKTPNATAVVFENQSLTYTKLNGQANQLAHHLRTLGVGPDVLVGLCVERSLEMIIGLLGILKAGGAYVPLDPTYPKERLAFMLADCQAPMLLTQSALLAALPAHSAQTFCLDTDWPAVSKQNSDNLPNKTLPENLSYAIYTSGSTGQPKKSGSTHQNIINLLEDYQTLQSVGPNDRGSLWTSLSFDVSVWEILSTLCFGAELWITPNHIRLSGESFASWLEMTSITTAYIPPFMLTDYADRLKRQNTPPSLRRLLVGVESIPVALLRRILDANRELVVINGYGPTETTVCATRLPLPTEATVDTELTPIGTPVRNNRIYILDPYLDPVPIGVTGELFIGGIGLARGYLDRPDLTADKFVPDPHSGAPGLRLYKTGDLARYLPNGNIEFLGRIDHQVKLRGFRIELGEIETSLRQQPAVGEAAVLVREDSPGDRRIVAYVVAAPEAELDVSALRAHLKDNLPEYMVPAAFVFLDALPLTPNDKVDRKALPAPDARPALAETYMAPRNPTEQTLADIWAEVLRVDRVGIHDNFFELGGDSILGIQAISRASQAGLELTARQLFEHQTVAGLAAVAGTAKEITAEQGLVTGPVPLTPIQHWFFERQLPVPQHFNQSVLLEVHEALDPSLLESAIEHLLEHHDALRMRFEAAASGWQQTNAEHETHDVLTKVDLASHPAAERLVVLESTAAQLQASLDIACGPLLRAAHFDMGPDQPDRLLLIIHHLVVDGVSWRILVEDLYTAYKQQQSDQPVALPPKTTSFKHWSEQVQTYAQSDQACDELEYWLKLAEQPFSALPTDTPGGANTVGTSRTVSVSLSPEETQALLQEAPEAYHTQVNDLLLTALAQTLSTWSGSPAVWVDLEGHGREPFSDDLDVSRTVGWFTSLFPCCLDLAGIRERAAAIKAIKEQLRAVPHKGFGYGLLRYLGGSEERAKLNAMPKPEVCFNYLGRFDQVMLDTPLRLARENRGAEHHEDESNPYLLDISAMVTDGQLVICWTYSEQQYRGETIERLGDEFAEALRVLINHCLSAEAGGFTPSDFADVDFSQDDLDEILEDYESAQN